MSSNERSIRAIATILSWASLISLLLVVFVGFYALGDLVF
jgi:hypothetical protein